MSRARISIQVPLIHDPILEGLSINAQAAVLSDAAGQILLGNCATRVGREKRDRRDRAQKDRPAPDRRRDDRQNSLISEVRTPPP